MRRPGAAVGSALFLFLVPGVFAVLVPWWLTGWRVEPIAWPVRVVGVALIAAGLPVLLQAFVRFVVEGIGTPAPVAPPQRLVVGGLYRYVRNPMYLAVTSIVVGQALVLGRLGLLWYAAAGVAAFVAFVRFYEEPALSRRFGEQYAAYRRAVPAWLPRLTPWNPTYVDDSREP
jgi:protein-S-isoprenylcysteine O-methyltransferase Ste14